MNPNKNISLAAYLVALMIFMLIPVRLWAQTADCFASDGMEESRDYLSSSFQWENDIGNSDRWYTNGMKYSRTKNLECNNDSFDSTIGSVLRTDRKAVLLSSWVGGMNMYTPQIITIAGPQPYDRPWTGWAYLGREWKLTDVIKNESGYAAGDNKKIEIQVGVLGAWAHQGNVQRAWHSLIGAQTPQGWANQKPGEIGVSVAYTNQKKFNIDKLDANGRAGFIVGNVVNQVSVGAGINYTTNKLSLDDPTYLPVATFSGEKQIAPAYTVELMGGVVAQDIAHRESVNTASDERHKLARAREAWHKYSTNSLFADIEGKLIGSSTFISGTNVLIVPVVVDTRFGWAHKFSDSDCTLRFTRLIRSPEFKYPAGGNAPWQKIWQLSLEWNWGFVKNPHEAQ